MTDPFEALREPVTPADPDIGFAIALRARLTREIVASGGTMSQQTAATRVEREPAWPPTLTPYIVVSDARRAMDWYIEMFGAQRRGEVHVNADGTIGHAEVGIGDAVLMFAEASGLWPDVPVRAPDSPATFSHSLHLDVEDVDGTTERARRNGAAVERPPTDQPYGRGSVIVDPRWLAVQQAQPALLPLDPPPVVGKLVPGNPDQPRDRRIGPARLADRVHGGQERLGGEVLGQAGVAAAGQQVAVDVRQRIVVQLQQPQRWVGPHLRVRHTLIVATTAGTPTG